MINLSIKTRVFMLAFMPMLLITAVLSTYFLHAQLEEIDNSINNRGISMAMHLANASEYGMFSGNMENISSLLKSSTAEEDVISITLYDETNNFFAGMSKYDSMSGSLSKHIHNSRSFRQPIILHTLNLSDESLITPADERHQQEIVIGWLDLVLSTNQLEAKRNRILWDSGFMVLTGVIISILLSLWMGRALTNPIIRLTNSVHNVEQGNLDEVITTTSDGEIGMLEKGFKSMLEKVRLSQEDLQHKINETTSGLQHSLELLGKQNEKLIEARKKALEANNAKSRFLANITHEIRTPMNGILGFSRLLKKSSITGEQRDYIETIEKSADSLLHLIEDILDISRVEAGKFHIQKKTFDLQECIEGVIHLMTPAASEKSLDISLHYYSDTPTYIHAARDRIRQVLINLLNNAIKFSDRGTITIRVMIDPDEQKTNSILISVVDEGIGIPQENMNQLFVPFTQLDDTSTREHGGTGLGLAISKSIVSALDGDIGLESTPGQGSKFWFTFSYQPTDTQPSQHSLQEKSNFKELKILVAEDNPINTKLIQTVLGKSGAIVTYVNNGMEALNIFHKKDFDIVLMDIQMPKMSGQEATEQIRKSPGNKRTIPIIGMTANAMSDDIASYREAGFSNVLTKPITVEHLLNEISYWCKSDNDKNHNLENISATSQKDSVSNNSNGDINQLGISKKLSDDLYNMLVDELPSVSSQLKKSFTKNDWNSLRKQTHKLLGGISYCNVPELKKCALSFQASLRNGSDSLTSDYNALITEIDKLASKIH